MIFSGDRDVLRRMYKKAWAKKQARQPLTALEEQIARVVEQHPEYHDAVESGDLTEDYRPEGGVSNPFLHMGLHLGLRDQVATDRPAGVRALFERLASSLGDAHAAEHAMIECLAEMLWEAQKNNRPPDEKVYLERLRRLC